MLGAHVLRSVLTRMGVQPLVYLPHRDEGYGLATPAVHTFSRRGTDLVITVDKGSQTTVLRTVHIQPEAA